MVHFVIPWLGKRGGENICLVLSSRPVKLPFERQIHNIVGRKVESFAEIQMQFVECVHNLGYAQMHIRLMTIYVMYSSALTLSRLLKVQNVRFFYFEYVTSNTLS